MDWYKLTWVSISNWATNCPKDWTRMHDLLSLSSSWQNHHGNQLKPTSANDVTQIQLCYGSYFQLKEPIDITGKSFSLNCTWPEQCRFSAINSNLFVGAPVHGRFVFLMIENSDASSGGTFHLTGGKMRFWNLQIQLNKASKGSGGAILLKGKDTELSVRGSIFWNNAASESGGAIAMMGGAKLNVFRTSFLENTAKELGGALHIGDGGVVDLSWTLWSGNKASSGNDMYVERDGANGGSFVDCSAILFNTFCNGRDGIVGKDDSGQSGTNCESRGRYGHIDHRCGILKLIQRDP